MMNDSRNTRLICFGASLAAIFIVYLPVLNNYPVADSWVFLVPHTFGETLAFFGQSIIPPEFDTLWLRPIPMFLFWLDTLVWPGTNWWGPHLMNIILHIINAALIWKLTGILIGNRNSRAGLIGQCAACLIYGLHPLAVGAVAWIAARFDVLSLTFGLAGTLLWTKADRRGGWRLTAAMLVMLVLSLLSKEQGIIFMAAVFIASAIRLGEHRDIVMHRLVLASLAAIVPAYILYRFAVFGGLGGYLAARHGLSIFPPLNYGVAILNPFMNVFPGWTFRWTLALGIICIIIASGQLRKPAGPRITADPVRLMVPALVAVFALATTMPNPGLTFTRIMDHAESRFALMAIAGVAVLAGVALQRLSSSRYRLPLVLIIAVWSAAAAWRTDVQLQSWQSAGECAQRIVETTKQLAPDPDPGSALIFLDIPRENSQFSYIFGIGLEEAIRMAYDRDDIQVVRSPTREDLNAADPDRDYVFHWDASRRELERLYAVRE